MNYAVLSSDSNTDYLFLLPITCFSWARLGYTPVVYLINVPHAQTELIKRYSFGATIENLDEPVEGISGSTMSQIVRLYACMFFDVDYDDTLITGDSDMLVVKDIFSHDVSNGQIISYGFDLTGRSEIPMCYIKATTSKWRELMKWPPGIESMLGEFADKARSPKWEDFWSVDQQLLTTRAREYGFDKITFVDRGHGSNGLPTGRWDRHDWLKVPDDIIDVHMLRSPMHPERWPLIKDMCKRLWPHDNWEWLEDYKREFEAAQNRKFIPMEVTQEVINWNPSGAEDIALIYGYPSQLLSSDTSYIIPNDEFGFLQNLSNWNNHRPALLLALFITNGDVYEFGSGDGSTPYLRNYCKANKRHFQSFDSNEQWALKCGSIHVSDWDELDLWSCAVAFVDLAPGEYRHIMIKRLIDYAEIIVVHDSELGGAGDYKLEPVFNLFKYQLHYNRTGGGAGASMLSNTIDVSKYAGMKLGEFQFDV